MKKVFCIAYGGGHINIIKHVYFELQSRPKIEANILALTMADNILTKENIPHSTIGDYLDIFDYKNKIVEYGYNCIRNQDIAKEIRYIDSVVYHGIGYYDLENSVGKEEAQKLYALNGRKAFLPVNSMKEIIKKEKPDVLLITNSPRMETAAGIAANELNIPVVRVNDLPYMNKTPLYKAKVCVMNEWAKNDIINRKLLDEEDIFVTGQPVFEDDMKLLSEKIKEYEVSIKNRYEKVILYLGQGYTREADRIINILREVATNNPKWLVICRPHPNDSYDYITKYGITNNLIFSKEGELKYLLKISDVAITINSTSGLQSVLLGTPLIQMDILEDSKDDFYIPGASVLVEDTLELTDAINKLIDEKSYNSSIMLDNMKIYGNKANAAANIADVVMNQIEL